MSGHSPGGSQSRCRRRMVGFPLRRHESSVIDRRTFIGTATVGALMLSFRVTAQRSEKLSRVALVFNNIPVAGMTVNPLDRAFVDGLRDLGLVEGRNIVIERRSAEGRYERIPSIMQELVALPVDVIVTTGPSVG